MNKIFKTLKIKRTFYLIFLYMWLLSLSLYSLLGTAERYPVYRFDTYSNSGKWISAGSSFAIRDKNKRPYLVTAAHVVLRPGVKNIRISRSMTISVENRLSKPRSEDVLFISLKNSEEKFFTFLPITRLRPSKGEQVQAISAVNGGLIKARVLNNGLARSQHRILPGDSGGPVYNRRLEVVGVVTNEIVTMYGEVFLGFYYF